MATSNEFLHSSGGTGVKCSYIITYNVVPTLDAGPELYLTSARGAALEDCLSHAETEEDYETLDKGNYSHALNHPLEKLALYFSTYWVGYNFNYYFCPELGFKSLWEITIMKRML